MTADDSVLPHVGHRRDSPVMLLQTVSLALAAGAVLGFLGATLSRVAMRILALTSPARLKDSLTDDPTQPSSCQRRSNFDPVSPVERERQIACVSDRGGHGVGMRPSK
jgi:hypothetical protein